MERLLIVGAGQYGVVAKETAVQMGRFSKIDFLDDKSPNAIGTVNDCAEFVKEYRKAFIAVGNHDARQKIAEKLEKAGYSCITLVNPTAYISPSAHIGEGSIIEAHATVSSHAHIGRFCIISAGAVVNHNSILGDFCHIDCGAVVCSNAVMKEKSTLSCGEIGMKET